MMRIFFYLATMSWQTRSACNLSLKGTSYSTMAPTFFSALAHCPINLGKCLHTLLQLWYCCSCDVVTVHQRVGNGTFVVTPLDFKNVYYRIRTNFWGTKFLRLSNFQDFRDFISFHSEKMVSFIFEDLLYCVIASQITYLCIAKDIV